ncbi:MAG: fimbrillin family protein [Bacteroidales bacterium]|nr:fimbrillin family protein [Bacteroidales bacterium]
MKRILIYIFGIVLCLSCNGHLDREKTPVQTAVLLDKGAARTKASGSEFAKNDSFVAYLRHVNWNGTDGERTVVEANGTPLLVTFTKGSEPCTAYTGADITPTGTGSPLGMNSTNTRITTDITPDHPLFWDDFSEDGKGDDKNIMTPGHYLQSYYGYCYNGGSPSSDLAESTGVLEWTVPYDQSTLPSIQTLDLLWSAEQRPVAYSHGSSNTATEHGTIIFPFTHAMSMVTVTVNAKDGFAQGDLDNASVELQEMYRSGTFTAPVYGISNQKQGADNPGLVKMHAGTAENMSRTYKAIVVPGKLMVEGSLFLKVTNADGNDYVLNLSTNILSGWAGGLTDNKMQPGYNYQLTVNVSKAGLDCEAMLKDWITVESEADGQIKFDTDLKNIQTDTQSPVNGSFDLYRGTELGSLNKVSTITRVGSSWACRPAVYWQDALTNYYFRGLCVLSEGTISSVNDSKDASSGKDLLWATTPKHKGEDINGATQTVEEGDAIKPRTSQVPLRFEHAMSRVKFILQTGTGEDAVDLTGASITIPDVLSGGTIAVADGNITPSSATHDIVTSSGVFNVEIPQSLDGRRLTVTLNDGNTKYSVLLTNCKDGNGNYITKWQRGRSYVYTITLGKEEITFRAMIKEWVETTGGGNASLDWD